MPNALLQQGEEHDAGTVPLNLQPACSLPGKAPRDCGHVLMASTTTSSEYPQAGEQHHEIAVVIRQGQRIAAIQLFRRIQLLVTLARGIDA